MVKRGCFYGPFTFLNDNRSSYLVFNKRALFSPSLSELVENYLKSIATVQEENVITSQKVRKLRGSLKLLKGFDDKSELGKAIRKKSSE